MASQESCRRGGLSKAEWIEELRLRPHPVEGGYYRQWFVSKHVVAPEMWRGELRPCMDTIFYMLTDDSPVGYFHRNLSDVVHFFHAGFPVRYTTINDQGVVSQSILGPDPHAGQELQLVIPGGVWKASELTGGSFGLLSEAIGPAFDPGDRVMLSKGQVHRLFPQIDPSLVRLASGALGTV